MSKPHERIWSQYHDESAMARYEEYAVWTTPSVFPPQITDNKVLSPLEHDYQSDVGQMVVALANKLMVSLFPFTKPFFTLGSEKVKLDKDELSELNKVATRACNSLFRYANYAKLVEALLNIIVTGNALLYREVGSGRMVAYSARRYCTRRDWAGVVKDIVIKEEVQLDDLPETYLHKLRNEGRAIADTTQKAILWTYVHFTDTEYVEQLFVDQVQVQEQSGPKELCPYVPMVWKLCTGEHSGRGLVEDLAGSIAKYSELSRALALYECEALRMRHMVDPTAQVDLKQFSQAGIGDFVEGNAAGITVHEGGEYGKIKQIQEELTLIEQRLQRAFMYTGQFRASERTTAEEIRQVVRAAEETFGGAYSQLGATVHTALAHLTVQDIDPTLAAIMRKQDAEITLETGLKAMSRSATTDAWLTASQELATVIPAVQQFAPTQDPVLVARQILEANGLDLRETARDEEQMQEAAAPTEVEQLLSSAQLPTPGVLPE